MPQSPGTPSFQMRLVDFSWRGAKRWLTLTALLCCFVALLCFSSLSRSAAERSLVNDPSIADERSRDDRKIATADPQTDNWNTLSVTQFVAAEPAATGVLSRRVQSTSNHNQKAVGPRAAIMRHRKLPKTAKYSTPKPTLPKIKSQAPLKPGPWLKWHQQCARNPAQAVLHNHTKFGFHIEESDVCQGDIFLLMFVQSKSDHRDRRDTIRGTYGSLENVENRRVRLIFVLAKPGNAQQQKAILQESQQYRDIVQSNHMDHYRNLTYTHLAAFNWIVRNCAQARFVLKLDDDTFVNLPHLMTLLIEGFKVRRNFIYGKAAAVTSPIRKKGSKWTVTQAEWPDKKYPQHCKGFAYILSGDTIEKLLHCSYFLPYFWIDDVFVSGELRHRTGTKLDNLISGFEYAGMLPRHASQEISNYIFLAGLNNEMLRRIWQSVWKSALTNYYS